MKSQTSLALVSDSDFPRLKEYILTHTGLHYYDDKDCDLAERVLRRFSKLSISDCAAYLNRLMGADGSKELDILISELTIGETYFFRHSEQFDALQNIIFPEIIERNQQRKSLRIWSAGCSNGAELYSVAILLGTHFINQIRDWDIKILGTDINKDFLAQARSGTYEEWAFRGTASDLKPRCFTQSGKKWTITPEFKKYVSFQYHNLITDPIPSPQHNIHSFDVILCRNVVIYFKQDNFRKIVSQFETCLNDEGWLLVGHSEPNTDIFQSFQMVSAPGAILYKRSSASAQKSNFVHPLNAFEKWSPPALEEFTPLPLPHPALSNGLAAVSVAIPVQVPPSDSLHEIRQMASRGEWDKAAAGCEALLKHDNLNAAIHFFYGLVLQHLGRDVDSEDALRRTVYLDRNCVLAHYYLGVCQQKRLNVKGATKSYETVLRLLSNLPADHAIAEGDGLTAAELADLARIQMEALSTCEKQSTGTK